MVILGLTGSIAMGKTWAAKCFRILGVPVHDADASVHALLAPGGAAVRPVLEAFADVGAQDGGVDRQKLGALAFGDDDALRALEAIVHPLVHDSERRFLERCARAQRAVVVLDIPLLFETDSRPLVDQAVVVSAPGRLQRRRALRRPGMTVDKLDAILARQVPDDVKRRVAEFVIQTGGPRARSLQGVAQVVKVAKSLKGRAWGPHWGR